MAFGEGSITKPSQYAPYRSPEERATRLQERQAARELAREQRQQLRDESRRDRLSEKAKNESIEANLREGNNRSFSEKKTEARASDNENTKNLTRIQSETIVGKTTKSTFGETQRTPTFTAAESRSFTLPSVLLQVCRNGNPALYQFYGGYVRDL